MNVFVLLNTKEDILKKVCNMLFWGTIDFHSRKKNLLWKSMGCRVYVPTNVESKPTPLLIRVTNDLLLSSDRGCISLLVLLDLSV